MIDPQKGMFTVLWYTLGVQKLGLKDVVRDHIQAFFWDQLRGQISA